MSSEISTDTQPLAPHRRSEASGDGELAPWQFFTLAGLIGATIVVFVSEGQSPAAIVLLSLTIFAAAGVGLAAWRTFAPAADQAGPAAPVVVGGRTRAALEREKVLALRAIKELEFDRAMGKVSEKDFAEMGARLRARATRILQQLDAGTGYRDAIEKEIEKRVGVRKVDPTVSAGAGSRARVPTQARRDGVRDGEDASGVEGGSGTGGVSAPAVAAPTCQDCGSSNDVDARFCKRCGAKLGGAA